jgi:hypothetical protein
MLRKHRAFSHLSSAVAVDRRTLLQEDGGRKRRADTLGDGLLGLMYDYYLRDSSSRLTTGVKQTRSFKGVKEQLRLLNDSVWNLRLQFLAEYPEWYVGATKFYSARPFFVCQPRLQDREQCGCIKCCNFQVPSVCQV